MKPLYHYAALVESSDDAIVAKDLDSRVMSWNPAAERIFGYSAEEMIGRSIRLLMPEDRQEEEDEILERIRAGERVGQFFTERLHKNGHIVQVSVTVSPVKDENGRIVGASKIARDASEHIAMMDRLLESEERFRLLAENISQFAWIARGDGTVYWYNHRWYEYTGTTLAIMRKDGWASVHHPDYLKPVIAKFRHCLETGKEWEDIFPLRAADGTYRWFLSRAIPIRNKAGDGTHWFGTNTDITEQRDQAEHIKLLLNEVNHRSKNMLMKIRAIARRTQGATPDFLERFDHRLASLAVNQDILVRQRWREVPVAELVALQLKFLGEGQKHVAFDGPDAALNPRAAEAIGMALYELATNSLKYGALSVAEGKVAIAWEVDLQSGRFAISWRESGGPETHAPQRTGFGTTLILDVPRHALQAAVSLDYAPDGVRWTLESDQALAGQDSSGQELAKDLPSA